MVSTGFEPVTYGLEGRQREENVQK